MDIEDARARLDDILTAISDIRRLTHEITLEEYTADKDAVAAVERYFERLSEASRHVPERLKAQHHDIPWRRIADLGNVLRHAYNQVSDERLWLAAHNDVGPLAEAVNSLLQELERQEGTAEEG